MLLCMRVPRAVFVLSITAVGLLASCEAVCGCLAPPPREIVYGSVESATGTGIPTAVVLYRIAIDSVCVFDAALPDGEIDVRAEGRFRQEVYGLAYRIECLELRAFDPATGKTDTLTVRLLADFGKPDSTGVMLRLP
jgi:hypothetical protein